MPIYCVSLINDKIYVKTVNSQPPKDVVKNQVFYDTGCRKAFRVYINAKNQLNAKKKGEHLLEDFMATVFPRARGLIDDIKQGVPVYLRFPPKYFSEKATLHKISKTSKDAVFTRVWRELDGIRSHNVISDEDQVFSFLAAHSAYVISDSVTSQ